MRDHVLDEAPLGIFVVDADLRIREVNSAAQSGFARIPDVIGRDFVEVLDVLWREPYASEILGHFRHTLATGESYVAPLRLEERKERSAREFYDWRISRVPLSDGRFGVACYFQDISEFVRAERAWHDSEQRFAAIFKQAAGGIASTDLDGRFLMANDRYCEIVGRSREELLTLTMQDITHPDDLPQNLELVRRAIEANHPFTLDKRYLRPDGSTVWVSNDVTAVRDASGQPVTLIAIAQDITERVEAEQRKDEFLATLAHELRNPLAPIRNAVDLLGRIRTDPERFERTRTMMDRQVCQLVRLIDDLLDVGRIRHGRIDLRKERIELHAIIHQAVETSLPAIERMEHELTIGLPPRPVHLEADAVRLAQVISNLLNNACKFTPRGGRIRLTAEFAGGGRGPHDVIEITVADNGIGMTAGELTRVFGMFAQADATLERSQGGLGIGLTLVERLVEMHDGTVEARSAGIGQGSEFIVRLPAIVEHAAAPAPASPRVDAATPSPGRRVLVVDDNVDAAQSLATLLSFSGHVTSTAHDGLEAVDTAANWRPDVVLLDIGMPGINGFEAGRRIREQPGCADTVLIALTGWGQDEDRARSREAGFSGHFVKPVDLGGLLDLLAHSERAPPARR